MKRIAVFTWKGPLPSDEEVGADPATCYSADFGEQWAYQACLPVAVAVMEAFRSLGYAIDNDMPYFDEHGWLFKFDAEPKTYSMMVSWIPRGNRNDGFAAQLSIRRGCIAAIFGRRQNESDLRPGVTALGKALDHNALIADVEWVDKIA